MPQQRESSPVHFDICLSMYSNRIGGNSQRTRKGLACLTTWSNPSIEVNGFSGEIAPRGVAHHHHELGTSVAHPRGGGASTSDSNRSGRLRGSRARDTPPRPDVRAALLVAR